ncbi:PRC and DUF2382 domain-containing protein [Streptomyces specialis]|uniref:PRC and DUF2382 domain-containing protein n=1 Tax=Streptomyces specialis TaxID=498367 RepID=UPI00073E3A64|nr:PRC and DUF2382 domain-containing protein [Streptomyces specialis]
MITREQIPTVMNHPVHGAGGSKIGKAEHVFIDDVTGRPEWVGVKTAMFGGGDTLVPIRDATVVGDHLEVPYPKDKIKDAPQVDVDSTGHLSEQGEHRLYDYYGIDRSASGQRAGRPAPGPAPAARNTDDAMTRSEEHLRVGTERRASGRARLHKYVVTEEEQQTIPLRHEEARVVREPVTEANRGPAEAGPEISEAEHELTLHAERPVVETRAEPVERVRLTTEERTEQQTVKGKARKERIEADIEEEGKGRRA